MTAGLAPVPQRRTPIRVIPGRGIQPLRIAPWLLFTALVVFIFFALIYSRTALSDSAFRLKEVEAQIARKKPPSSNYDWKSLASSRRNESARSPRESAWSSRTRSGPSRRWELPAWKAEPKPREVVVLETVGPDGDTKYWRDSDGVHHVPKRRLDDIIIG